MKKDKMSRGAGFAPGGKNIIGIDIGGSKITGVLFDGKKAVKDLTIVTPKNLFEFQRNLLKLVNFLSSNKKITGVGVGVAGLVDPKKGIIKYSPNIKFIKDLNLAKFLSENKIKRVNIDNDANCFARAELMLGQGKKYKNFLAMTLGTGVGGGIVINGKLYRGQNYSGAELGHIVMGSDYFEKYFQRLRNEKSFRQAGQLIGKALASFINIFAPEAIIIGGGYGHNESKKYLPTAKSAVKHYIFNDRDKTKILISNLKNAGALGAALSIV